MEAAVLGARSGNVTIIAKSAKLPGARKKHYKSARCLRTAGILLLVDDELLAAHKRGLAGYLKARDEVVVCLNQNGKRIVCGLVNYSSEATAEATAKSVDKSSEQISPALCYSEKAELIHCDKIRAFKKVKL